VRVISSCVLIFEIDGAVVLSNGTEGERLMRRSRYASFGPMLTALGFFLAAPTVYIWGPSNLAYKVLALLATINAALVLGMRLEEGRWRKYLRTRKESDST
jgi:hypothetical protein